MASPMPEDMTIPVGDYANLLMIQESADYVWGIIKWMADQPDEQPMITAQEFARNLLDEWTK